jgi:hypothetical protein
LFWAGAGPFYFGFGPVLVRFILCRAGAGPFHVRLVSAHFHVGPVLAHFVVCWAISKIQKKNLKKCFCAYGQVSQS